MINFKIHKKISNIPANLWNACAGDENPFLDYNFLWCLEESGTIGENTGWLPYHISLEKNNNIIAVAPLYIKLHSQGEYVFDHSWANAYQNAGGNYYPKLQASIPFSPVTGNRILIKNKTDKKSLGEIIKLFGKIVEDHTNALNFSSAHITFCSDFEAKNLSKIGFLHRIGEQFHWKNNNYKNFNDFLLSLSSRKRKTINKERTYIKNSKIEIIQKSGDNITSEDINNMFEFYINTTNKKWGSAYLNKKFFNLILNKFSNKLLIIFAKEDGIIIAGALHIIGKTTLFGRYWGLLKDVKFLHFELCYYQAIEWAISHKINFVEGGAQGFHKVQRGYLPVETHSSHYIRNDKFKKAVREFIVEESNIIEKDINFIKKSYSPYKNR